MRFGAAQRDVPVLKMPCAYLGPRDEVQFTYQDDSSARLVTIRAAEGNEDERRMTRIILDRDGVAKLADFCREYLTHSTE